ncbi:MAG: hypothetical protein Alpg2KO_25060 [Alphaproteobacteria bacterium]
MEVIDVYAQSERPWSFWKFAAVVAICITVCELLKPVISYGIMYHAESSGMDYESEIIDGKRVTRLEKVEDHRVQERQIK